MTESEQGLREIFARHYGGCLTSQEDQVMVDLLVWIKAYAEQVRRRWHTAS